eukprot:TRINITY_DN5931_c0_g1_i1.p1 TRINITY_DN5931_c0_g1~~TRINITY_DN5931_c0_g1_i1.p1  ORF type:complete len:288 (-),score=94.47 TRINITY_DN5931_c0_g1_i1:132-995(-)
MLSSSSSLPFVDDIRILICDFLKLPENNFSFATFKTVWIEKKFSLIHTARLREFSSQEFTKSLFLTAIGYMFNDALSVQIAAFFCLYLLYETQLQKPKIKITVTPASWQQLLDLYSEVKKHKLVDAYHIFIKMKSQNYFCFAATASATTSFTSLPFSVACQTINATRVEEFGLSSVAHNTLGEVLDINNIDQVFTEYQNAKKDLLKIEKTNLELNEPQIANKLMIDDLKAIVEQHEKNTFMQLPGSIPKVPPLEYISIQDHNQFIYDQDQFNSNSNYINFNSKRKRH